MRSLNMTINLGISPTSKSFKSNKENKKQKHKLLWWNLEASIFFLRKVIWKDQVGGVTKCQGQIITTENFPRLFDNLEKLRLEEWRRNYQGKPYLLEVFSEVERECLTGPVMLFSVRETWRKSKRIQSCPKRKILLAENEDLEFSKTTPTLLKAAGSRTHFIQNWVVITKEFMQSLY